MLRYILKRIVAALITLWFVITITFFLMKAMPGSPFASQQNADPAIMAAMNAKYGLDDPVIVQYFRNLFGYLTGDFGISYTKLGLTTNQIIAAGFPDSIRIGLFGSAIVVIGGVLGGVISALRQNKFTDRFTMVLATLGSTIPSFVFATGFLYLFSKTLGLVPAYGLSNWKGYIGPSIVISLFSLAFTTRLMRTSLLDVLGQDYIRTARAKGISEYKVIGKHAMRNAILPVVTYLAPMFASILTGSFVIEKVFGIPGIGKLFTESITNRDYTLIMGMTVFFSVLLVVSILVVDIVYVFIDPRIKYED